MFFNGWSNLLNVLVLAPLTYAALIILIQLSGKRTLSKMNAFDFIVTIALGSIFASTVLIESVALTEGVAAMTVLVALQYLLTFLSVRSKTFERLIKAEPTLLYHDGSFVISALRLVRVTQDEVYAAVRQQGHASLEKVRAVVLENEGSFSVLAGSPDVALSSLELLDFSSTPHHDGAEQFTTTEKL